MPDLNEQQRAAMGLIHGTKRPDDTMTQHLLTLATVNGLPPRVVGSIETYQQVARDAARLAANAKEAEECAKDAWLAVVGEAGKDDDLVDLANERRGGEKG